MDEDEGKGVSITDQPHLMLTLVCSESTQEKEWEEARGGR